MKALAKEQKVQERIDEILEKVRQTPKVWSEEEVLELAYDPSHLSTDQLFDYCEGQLNAAARAEVESHAARCDFCLHQLAELGRLVPPPHPSLAMLVQFVANTLPAAERQGVQSHLEPLACPRCVILVHALQILPFLRRRVEEVRQGVMMTPEQIRAGIKAIVSASAPLPAPVGGFDPITRPPFQLLAVREDGSLTVTLCETDKVHHLVAYVETPDPEKAGQTVYMGILGEGEPLTAEVVLEAQGEHGCAAQHNFGSFRDLAPRLGADCTVWAAFME
jgi:hypothetical protein